MTLERVRSNLKSVSGKYSRPRQLLGKVNIQINVNTVGLNEMGPRTLEKVDIQQGIQDARPTIADLHGDNHFAQLAQQHWLKTTRKSAKVKVKPDVLKNEIWDVLKREDFSFKSLLLLENLQLLEKFGPFQSTFLISGTNCPKLSLARLHRRFVELPCTPYFAHHECQSTRAPANMGYVSLEALPNLDAHSR